MNRYRFIEAERVNHRVGRLCRVVKVSRAAYYRWATGRVSRRRLENELLLESIRGLYDRSRRTYGSPRVHAELRVLGIRCSENRVARLMRRAGLKGRTPRQFLRTTVGDPKAAFPDLVGRRFQPTAPDQTWVSDISYVRTDEGWLYVAIVLDCFSRKVVGWSMANTLHTQLTIDALRMALESRRPEPGLVCHSDRGCQYTSEAYGRVLEAWGCRQSVSRKGNCYDNAVAESFFSTLKSDLVYRSHWRTRADARQAIFEYIEAFVRHEALLNRVRCETSPSGCRSSPMKLRTAYPGNCGGGREQS